MSPFFRVTCEGQYEQALHQRSLPDLHDVWPHSGESRHLTAYRTARHAEAACQLITIFEHTMLGGCHSVFLIVRGDWAAD